MWMMLGANDRFHFFTQKPTDLEGECPFTFAEKPCPYGLACRFGGTHKDGNSKENMDAQKEDSEVNVLKKDVQKLLWKNNMKFPKSNAALKQLGLVVWTESLKLSLRLFSSCLVDG